MEEINKFLKGTRRYVAIFFLNVSSVLSILMLLHLLQVVNLNLFIEFKYSFCLLILSLTIFWEIKYEISQKGEKIKKTVKLIFFLLFILETFRVTNINLSFNIISASSFSLSDLDFYTNILFLSSASILLWIYRKHINNQKLFDLKNKYANFTLLFILIIFTLIKSPFFSNDFTGEHSMKYNSYVEPAKYMVENRDFTWYQLKYLSDPINNPDGIMEKLPQLPILEWSLASAFYLFPNIPIEMITRIITHTVGLMTLIFAFLLIRKWGSNIFSIIATVLLATNSVIALASFVTVYDGINFMLLLLTLYFFTAYYDQEKSLVPLILSGLIAGIAISAKVSFLVWVLPITIFITLIKNKNYVKMFFNLSLFYLFAGLVYVSTKFSIPTLRNTLYQSLLILIVCIILILSFSYILDKYEKPIKESLRRISSQKLTPFVLFASVVIFIYLIYNSISDTTLARDFLTDKRLLFNFEFYEYMFKQQFIPYITKPIFILTIAGLYSLMLTKKNNPTKLLTIGLTLTSIFFWIIASKSIFPHSYYTEVIILSFMLFASFFLSTLFSIYRKNSLYLFIITMCFASLLIFCSKNTKTLLSKHINNYEEAAEYLSKNTEEGDLYIDDSYLSSLTLETGISRVGDINYLSNEIFKKDIKELGFKEAMDKYNIKYLITFNENPDYQDFAQMFSDDYLETTEFDRGQIILNIIDPNKYKQYSDSSIREALVRQHKLEKNFTLEKEIGPYRFFTFSN